MRNHYAFSCQDSLAFCVVDEIVSVSQHRLESDGLDTAARICEAFYFCADWSLDFERDDVAWEHSLASALAVSSHAHLEQLGILRLTDFVAICAIACLADCMIWCFADIALAVLEKASLEDIELCILRLEMGMREEYIAHRLGYRHLRREAVVLIFSLDTVIIREVQVSRGWQICGLAQDLIVELFGFFTLSDYRDVVVVAICIVEYEEVWTFIASVSELFGEQNRIIVICGF